MPSILPDFCQLSLISLVFYDILQNPNILPFWYFLCNFMKILFCGINTTECFLVKIHEKYQKGNIFNFYKMLKSTPEIPDYWQKSGICREDLLTLHVDKDLFVFLPTRSAKGMIIIIVNIYKTQCYPFHFQDIGTI